MPIPISVVDGNLVAATGAFNVNRLKELIPTVQFYSTNPRNSAINIRGLGAPFGLTNDGLEPGVGLYVDGVFHAVRPAATLDFLDVERIEVLRGPQGTLFGKNTSAGAINVTTRKPSFTPRSDVELNFGGLRFRAGQGLDHGTARREAGRAARRSPAPRATARSTTPRTESKVNELRQPRRQGPVALRTVRRAGHPLVVDVSRQRPDGYTQVVAGVAPTLRPANRQYPQIAADLGYAPPSFNAFDRLTDVDTPAILPGPRRRLGQCRLADRQQQLTSTSAWRYWNWTLERPRLHRAAGDDGVRPAPSRQRQFTQEVRYAGDLSPRVNLIVGAFAFHQTIDSDPGFQQEQGAAAARFLLAPSANAATPGLLDGYGYNQYLQYANTSAAVFGQLAWSITDRLRLLPGIRINYDHKDVDFRSAGLRRPADQQSRADCPAAVDLRAAGLSGERQRRQYLRSA